MPYLSQNCYVIKYIEQNSSVQVYSQRVRKIDSVINCENLLKKTRFLLKILVLGYWIEIEGGV